MLLNSTRHVFSVLNGLLHLIENKIYAEIVASIPIYTSGSWGINEIASKWERCFC